ncbi:hypothetical protein L5515_007839 [Caenorhabditis briggsae]|uniref:Uncharacterized protein n=1 Tax=Caenorhabditis briggsae TaxID=6238 RepID=A0AAE9JMR8_CAEBR|nr:hypothetical protein L5515_007839 [Caenorhabditis briggsae]
MISGYYNQALNNISFVTMTLYGATATLTMLFLHNPYKKFVFSVFPAREKTNVVKPRKWKFQLLTDIENNYTENFFPFTAASIDDSLVFLNSSSNVCASNMNDALNKKFKLPVCPSGWYSWNRPNGRLWCYMISKTPHSSSQTYDSANNYCQKTFNASLNGFQTAKERSTFITNLKSLDILSYGWTFLGAIKTCGSARCPLSVPYQWQNGVSTNHTLANDFFYQPWLDGSGNCLGLVYKYQMGLFGDVMLGTLTIPYVFFPVISGTPLGILTRFFDINAFFQTYIAVACVAEVGSSIVFMFENRQSQTVTSSWKITSEKSRKSFYAINMIFPWLASTISLMRIPEQTSAKLEMLKTIPCPTIEFFQMSVIIVTTDAKSIGLALMLLLLFYTIQLFFFIIHSSFYLCISTKSYAVSEKTKKLKRKYFVAVCIQIMVPFAIMAVPVSYYAFSIVTDYYNQSANNFFFLIMSIHGFFSTVATIVIYENYRNYILHVLRIRRNLKVTLIQSKSMAETTYI